MTKFLILKTGGTFPAITFTRGDFEHWTADEMGVGPNEWYAANVQENEPLPSPNELLGCVITGSHSMVTDSDPWIQETRQWIQDAVEFGIPMLGICFGHQLMADALGGRAGFHPDGLEIGTVDIRLTAEKDDDPLFKDMPDTFPAHVTHSQSALELPPGAAVLAASDHEAHQAFRVGKHAWGVQFHPEFDATATRYYVDQLKEKIVEQGGDPKAIRDGVKETPISTGMLKQFVEYCRDYAWSF